MLKTARNILIANMAVSGLLLCLITMPLSVTDLVTNHWDLTTKQVWLIFEENRLTSVSRKLSVRWWVSHNLPLFSSLQSRSCWSPSTDFSWSSFPVLPRSPISWLETFSDPVKLFYPQAYLLSCFALLSSAALSSPVFIVTKVNVVYDGAAKCYQVGTCCEFFLEVCRIDVSLSIEYFCVLKLHRLEW